MTFPPLQAAITRVWSGISFESVEQARELAAETRTKSGLCVFTNINRKKYNTSRCVDSNYDDVRQRHITFDKELPKWNYKFSWRDKNTKLIFKRYLIDCSVSRTDFSLSHAVISYKYPHASTTPKHFRYKETILLVYAYRSNMLILAIKLSKTYFSP